VHHERVEPPHLFFQEADGVVELVAAERIAAHELRQAIGFVDLGGPDRPHFVDGHGRAPIGRLPRGLAAGQSTPDDVNHEKAEDTGLRIYTGTAASGSSAASRT
jgi:hypothetical protein